MIFSFLQKGTYLAFPSRKNPKLLICSNSEKEIISSMGLYNPQVLRGKLLKFLYFFVILHFKFARRFFVIYNLSSKGVIIDSLERKFKKKLSTAVYISTEKDKYVIKLFNNNKTYAYLKIPINTIGVSRINNETLALKTLQKFNAINFYLDSDFYNNKPYLILKPLTTINKVLTNIELLDILDRYKKNIKHNIKNHPRVLQLLFDLSESKYSKFHLQISELVNNCTDSFEEVYEHGDFALWNIGETNNNQLTAFDFEYFIFRGIENFDLIKYHFLHFYLIKKYKGLKLYNSVKSSVDIDNFNVLFLLFIIKELLISSNNKYASDLKNILYIKL
jgi:hypothetical protein